MNKAYIQNGMYQSTGGNARFRSIPKAVSKFELIEKSIDEASKFHWDNILILERKLNNVQGDEPNNKVIFYTYHS